MTTPDVPAQLETALDELEMAKQTLALTLVTAHLTAQPSTYTAAIKRILAFNKQTLTSTQNLLTVLKRRARQPHPQEDPAMQANPTRKLTLDQRAARRLKRLTARRLKAMPLFVATGTADHVEPLPSIPEIKQWYANLEHSAHARMKAMRTAAHAQTKHYSLLVKGLVSPARLTQLCAQRRHLPSSPEYAADFWHRTYNSLRSLP